MRQAAPSCESSRWPRKSRKGLKGKGVRCKVGCGQQAGTSQQVFFDLSSLGLQQQKRRHGEKQFSSATLPVLHLNETGQLRTMMF